MVTATFITEDSYLGDIAEPLTLNRYNYCLSSYLNYADPSGNIPDFLSDIGDFIWDLAEKHAAFQQSRLQGAVDAVWQPALEMILEVGSIEEGIANYLGLWGRPYKQALNENMQWYNGLLKANMDNVESITGYYVGKCEMTAAMLVIGAYETAVAYQAFRNGVKLAQLCYNAGDLLSLLGRLGQVVLVDGSEILLATEAASEAIISARWIVSNARAGAQISQSHAGSEGGSGTQGVGNPVAVEERGNTGRTIPNTLNEQMAMHQVQSNPLEGATKVPLEMTAPRWPASEGWVKMQSVVQNADGTKTTIHFLYNVITGAFDDFKFK